jgi:hypothetical protein
MKEIWMQKLIELLNEYKKTRVKKYWIEFNIWEEKWELNIIIDDWQDNYSWWTCDTDIAISYIISKKFWFIERLIKNDKIDRDIMEGEKFYYYLEKSENMHWDKNFSRCERLLMLLSISDTPIEDLILYLK